MYEKSTESYNGAESGEKVTAAPGPCGWSSSNLSCGRAAQRCSFLMHLKIIVAYIYIYLHMYISIYFLSWAWEVFIARTRAWQQMHLQSTDMFFVWVISFQLYIM